MVVSRVNLTSCNLAADFDANGVLNAADVTLFNAAYATVDPSADLNHDSAVTAADAAFFCQSYACACNP